MDMLAYILSSKCPIMYHKKSEEEARIEIANMVIDYYKTFHSKPDCSIGNERISYAKRVYDEKEMVNLVNSALDFWLTSGRYTEEFENKFSEYIGVSHCAFVNSGSSANLIAFMTLTSPLLGERAINRGDEVITIACGFPTTISPIIQYGAIPVFIDITIPQYNVDTDMLDKALSKKTKAVMIAHTLGNPFNIAKIKDFCNRNKLWLIEDNCDALGSKYMLNGEEKFTGTFGDLGTSSFYPPHHMTTGEGGAVYTNNTLLNKIIISLRDWGRDCVCPSGKDNLCGNRFNHKYSQLPFGYDHKYVYSHFGYNLKATDMQAAIGVAQLDKLPMFIEKRKKNFELLYKLLSCASDRFILPEPCENSKPSWFGFLLTCRKGIDRENVVKYLEEKRIQTRMLFAGNLIKHPCFDTIRNDTEKYRTIGELINTNQVMNHSFWIGLYPGMSEDMIEYMAESIVNLP